MTMHQGSHTALTYRVITGEQLRRHIPETKETEKQSARSLHGKIWKFMEQAPWSWTMHEL